MKIRGIFLNFFFIKLKRRYQNYMQESFWIKIVLLVPTQESKAKENNKNKPRERWMGEFENPVNASQYASPIIELCVTNYHLACRNLYHCPQWFIRELTWGKYALCRDVNWNGLEDLPVAIRSTNTYDLVANSILPPTWG